MDVKSIIKFGEKVSDIATPKQGEPFLMVSEFFYGTIQGEGVHVGAPAAFLRLSGCPLNCKFCDTAEVWKSGQKISTSWLLVEMDKQGLYTKFKNGMHLVITGGSPLLQQKHLITFLRHIKHNVPVYVEVENEVSVEPVVQLSELVDCWNNSPKLSNSGAAVELRYNPDTIRYTGLLRNSWFKFVVKDEKDVKEIQEKYINLELVKPSQVILMPMGASRDEYEANREKVAELAVKNGFRYSPREHIAIWDKKTGI